jgi:exonuclease SbcD
VRLLHTSDWHVGKQLRGATRLDEHRAVLTEIVELAASERVDLVLVTGDVFDTAAPAPDAQQVAWDALLDLRATGAHVVVIAGNHDNQAAFDAWSGLWRAAGITMLGRAARPDAGGVVEFTTPAGEPVVCALVPFVSQRYAVRTEQLLALDGAEAAGRYAERMRVLIGALCAGFRPDAVNLLAAHCFVPGGAAGGGERVAHLANEYGVEAVSFPANANYVALGHLHRTQRINAAAPAWYAGSPIQVDFGEAEDAKHVLLVETAPGVPARVEQRALTSGWTLRTVEGSLDQLRALDPGDAWLRVVVQEPARAGLADEVRAILPRAVDVRVERSLADAPAREFGARRGRTPHDLFGDYLQSEGIADERIVALFDRLHDDALAEVP